MEQKKLLARALRNGQRGMTLIEIMVVVMIMGLVMSAVGFAVFRYYRRAQKRTTRATVETVSKAIWMWAQDEADKGDSDKTCPDSLDALVPDYIKSKKSLRDAWGKRLKFRCDGDNVCVYSFGPNKRDDGGRGDDIASDGCKGGGEE